MAGAAWERLRAIMGEPAYTPAQVPWELAPAELGVQLPSDYRAFIDLYGAVNLNGEWGVSSPAQAIDPGLPGGFVLWQTKTDGEFRGQVRCEDEFWDQEYTPIFPDPGGLLPWGSNSNHAYCCWLTTGPNPEQWPVAIFDCGGLDGKLDLYDGGFAQFVATVLTGGYAHEDELRVIPDPEDWGPARRRPLWTPAYDWDRTRWGEQWGVASWFVESWNDPAGALSMPWVRR
ncbi:SMI1/KNR4 family protein [Kitasatospora sp. NPDC057542]|uniref:SMI1/KNR4 family protein n=1 Tax=Kitasatospora sp. NPDC057542 TaxID=3346162 RepID=UPI003679B72A